MKPRMVHIVLVLLLLAAGCGDGETVRREDGKTVRREDGRTVGREDGRTVGREDGKTVGREDGRTVGREDGKTRQTANGERQTNSDDKPYYIPDYTVNHMSGFARARVEGQAGRGAGGDRLPGMTLEELVFFKRGKTAQEVVVGFHFDNDMWDYTDYYYTSGLALEFHHPAIAASPLSAALPGLRSSVNHYSLALQQNLYTPLKLDRDTVQAGDRPFAAWLGLEHRKVSLSPELRRRLESGLILGVIGPAAMGSAAQDLIHEDEPVGWANQVANDVVINYSLRLEQAVFSRRIFDLAVYGGGQAGTLYDNLKAGIVVQAGKSNGRYNSIFLTSGRDGRIKDRIRYYFSLDLENKLVVYDATLQGGMFNKSSVYTLQNGQVNRYVFTGKAGLGIGLGRFSLELEQAFLSPEFEGGRHHFWLRIRSLVYLD